MIGISFGSIPDATPLIMFIASLGELLSKAVFSKCITYFMDSYINNLHSKGEAKNMNALIRIFALCAAYGGMV